jgi:hypothetical protein
VGRGRHSETEQLFDLAIVAGKLTAVETQDADSGTWIDLPPSYEQNSSLVGTWRHFKGGIYDVQGEAAGPSGERVVVYTSDDGRVWLRPREMWSESVKASDYSGHRFTPQRG